MFNTRYVITVRALAVVHFFTESKDKEWSRHVNLTDLTPFFLTTVSIWQMKRDVEHSSLLPVMRTHSGEVQHFYSFSLCVQFLYLSPLKEKHFENVFLPNNQVVTCLKWCKCQLVFN